MQFSKVSSFRFRFLELAIGIILVVSCNRENNDIVVNPPNADFNFQPNAVNTLQGKFINNSTSIKSFIWNFGDGKVNTTVRSPLYTYKNAGTYSVTLTVVGWNDVEVSTTKEIVVTPPAAVSLLANSNFATNASWLTTYIYGLDITTTFNNKLTLSVAAEAQAGILIHQAVTLQPGTYQVTANYDVAASQYNAWAEFYLLPAEPVEGEEPEDEFKISGFESFGDCSGLAFSGDLSEVNINCRSGEDPEKGQVTVTTSGTYYFTIFTGVYDGNYGANFHLNSVGLFKL
jgi:PKD repeat protein